MRAIEKKRQDLGVTRTALAELIGVTLPTINRKLDGGSDFTLSEATKIALKWNTPLDELADK